MLGMVNHNSNLRYGMGGQSKRLFDFFNYAFSVAILIEINLRFVVRNLHPSPRIVIVRLPVVGTIGRILLNNGFPYLFVIIIPSVFGIEFHGVTAKRRAIHIAWNLKGQQVIAVGFAVIRQYPENAE